MEVCSTPLPYLAPATEVSELEGEVPVLTGSPTGESFDNPGSYDGF